MITEITISEDDAYTSLPEFEWETYQRGFLGILNNAYNQSCNSGNKVLGDMSEITSQFDGGSYQDFLRYYDSKHDGRKKKRAAIEKMTNNLIDRVESVGGSLPRRNAKKWSTRYIESMLVNSYTGFLDEARAIEIVGKELNLSYQVADPDVESDGIDGRIGARTVQVKPVTHNSLDINSFDIDWLITYRHEDGEFKIWCQDT